MRLLILGDAPARARTRFGDRGRRAPDELGGRRKAPIRHADRFFVGGQWVQPSSDAIIKVTDPGTEELFFSVAEVQAAEISRAVEAAREAFDNGPWTRLTHAERAGYAPVRARR